VPVKTQQQRSEEKRQSKLEQIQQQIDAGTLVVRKMTPEERKKFPPRSSDTPAKSKRRRPSS
jgi:hypothetical protein